MSHGGARLDRAVEFTATDVILGRSTSGAGVGEQVACTSAGRAILDDADAAAQRATLGAAPSDPQYVTLATSAGITNERVLAAGNQVTLTDAGAGSTVTVEWSPNPLRMARFWTDGSGAGDFSTLSSGTGAGTTANSANSDATHPGTMSSSTGTSTTGRSAACYIEAAAIELGTYAWRSAGCFKIPTLSDGRRRSR